MLQSTNNGVGKQQDEERGCTRITDFQIRGEEMTNP